MFLATIYIFSIKNSNGLTLTSPMSSNKIAIMENWLENINTIQMYNTN